MIYDFFVPCGNFGSPYLGNAQQLQEQRYPFLSMPAGIRLYRHWHGCQCLGFLTCTPVLMHASANVGWTDTVRESVHFKLTGTKQNNNNKNTKNNNKNPFPIQVLEPASVCSWLFSWTLCIPTELPPPLTIMKLENPKLLQHTRRRPALLASGKQFGEDVTRCDQDSERVKR